jgi:fructokinase
VIVGIETGGTKVVCGAVDEARPRELVDETRFPTTTPEETIGRINEFVAGVEQRGEVHALGVASFGPVNVEPHGPQYGFVTGTPKQGWANTDLLGGIALAARVPTVMLADVGSAAVGEQRWGAGAGLDRVAYATIGTGIGVGLVVGGALLHGNGFPELGHILVRKHPDDDFAGVCPFHGDCLEGLASGPAVLARWGADASSFPDDVRDQRLDVLAFYLAQLAATTSYAVGVQRFVLGGGVMSSPGLLDAVRRRLPGVSGGPGAGHAETLDADDFLVAPGLGGHSGLLGAVVAALDLLER